MDGAQHWMDGLKKIIRNFSHSDWSLSWDLNLPCPFCEWGMLITELHYGFFWFLIDPQTTRAMIIELKVDFRIFLQNALLQWRIKGIFIIIQPHLFFTSLPSPPLPLLLPFPSSPLILLLLLWALLLFVSFGLINNFLHSNHTPILNLHFSRSALTSSISSFLPGCNMVLIFHEPFWKTPVLIHLTCPVHLWLIRPSFPCWAFLAYYLFTLTGCWPIVWPWS